jgi:DNA-directed RNA polymerase III subunit RPC1
LLPFEILELVDDQLSNQKFRAECASAFVAMIRAFVLGSITRRVVRFRQLHGMYEAEERESDLDEHTDLTMGATGV